MRFRDDVVERNTGEYTRLSIHDGTASGGSSR